VALWVFIYFYDTSQKNKEKCDEKNLHELMNPASYLMLRTHRLRNLSCLRPFDTPTIKIVELIRKESCLSFSVFPYVAGGAYRQGVRRWDEGWGGAKSLDGEKAVPL
jgi:hypothetical protein